MTEKLLTGTLNLNTKHQLARYISDVIAKLKSVGIDEKAIHGARVPELSVGSDDQFIGNAANSSDSLYTNST